MSYIFYKSLHLGGLLLLFFSLGGLWFFYAMEKTVPVLKKQLLTLHGVSWLVVFITGFGLIARLKMDFPWPNWIYVKLLIWLFLGMSPLLLRKTLKEPQRNKKIQIAFLILILLSFLALYSVHAKL